VTGSVKDGYAVTLAVGVDTSTAGHPRAAPVEDPVDLRRAEPPPRRAPRPQAEPRCADIAAAGPLGSARALQAPDCSPAAAHPRRPRTSTPEPVPRASWHRVCRRPGLAPVGSAHPGLACHDAAGDAGAPPGLLLITTQSWRAP
jgi:hypothetical protein